jgi:N-acetylmuramoyl-L-alanine amidase
VLATRIAIADLAAGAPERPPHAYWVLGRVALVPAWLVVFLVLLGPTSTPRKEPVSALSVGHAEKANPVLLILDPGHGGKDRGGYNEDGFLYNGQRMPEDAYTFDVATRIETTANAKGWETFFTVIPLSRDSITPNTEQETILARRADAVYNLREKQIAVFPGKTGLRLRLDAVREALDRAPDSNSVFISIHFDYALPRLSGAKLYTAPELASHPFVKIVSKTLITHGLGYRNDHGQLDNIDTSQKFIVLVEGIVEPRVLIELGNFNNAEDRARILSGSGRQKYADIVIEALSKYLLRQNEGPRP